MMIEKESEDFTERMKPFLNVLTFDLINNKSKVKEKSIDFPGNTGIINQLIEKGIESFSAEDVQACKEIFNFIEWYSTGKISEIEVSSV